MDIMIRENYITTTNGSNTSQTSNGRNKHKIRISEKKTIISEKESQQNRSPLRRNHKKKQSWLRNYHHCSAISQESTKKHEGTTAKDNHEWEEATANAIVRKKALSQKESWVRRHNSKSNHQSREITKKSNNQRRETNHRSVTKHRCKQDAIVKK